MVNTTLLAGAEVRATSNTSVVPNSETDTEPNSFTSSAARSLSVLVTSTVWSVTPTNRASEALWSTDTTMLKVCGLSISESSTPWIVMICSTFHAPGWKVTTFGDVVASPSSWLVMSRRTEPSG